MTIPLSSGIAHKKRLFHPNTLCQYDIVLTTYDALRGDLHHVVGEEGVSACFAIYIDS
jgi:hypothetical protein